MSLNSFGAVPQGLPQPQAGPPAQEFDPNKEMTMGQFVQAMQNWHPMVAADAAAQTTRATWDVTPQEEAEALAAFPRLQQIAEPFRTPKIYEAVRLLRQGKQPQQQQQAPAQSQPGNGTNGVAPVTRSLENAHIAPLVEGNFAAPPELPVGGPGAPDGSTDAARARAEYEAAKRIQDPKQKFAAMRAASQKIQRIAGVTDRQILGSSWINRS